MTDVTVTQEWRIDADGMARVEVDTDGEGNVRLFQDGDGDGDTIIINPAAVPALIAALQAAAAEAEACDGKAVDLEQPDSHMGSASMKEQPGYGDWVRYDDYEAELTRLRARVDAADKLAEAASLYCYSNAQFSGLVAALSAYEGAK